jgi:hypothetical protein
MLLLTFATKLLWLRAISLLCVSVLMFELLLFN